MRILFLCFSTNLAEFFVPLSRALRKDGDDHALVTTSAGGPLPQSVIDAFGSDSIAVCNWSWFDFGAIERFQPDVIISWNGYAPWTWGAFQYLSANYPVVVVERGWFPQKDNLYFNFNGKIIADEPNVDAPLSIYQLMADDFSWKHSLEARVEGIRKEYEGRIGSALEIRTKIAEEGLVPPEGYILVPGQLDFDTSISRSIQTSFLSVDSFIGALQRKLDIDYERFIKKCGYTCVKPVKILCSNHPADMDKPRPCQVYNGKLSTLELAYEAIFSIGLSSTTLLEAGILGLRSYPIQLLGMNDDVLKMILNPESTGNLIQHCQVLRRETFDACRKLTGLQINLNQVYAEPLRKALEKSIHMMA